VIEGIALKQIEIEQLYTCYKYFIEYGVIPDFIVKAMVQVDCPPDFSEVFKDKFLDLLA